jgi:hypothetical protein
VDKRAYELLQEAQQLAASGGLCMSTETDELIADIAQLLVPYAQEKNATLEVLICAIAIGWIARKREEAMTCC